MVWGSGQNVYTTFASTEGDKQRSETGTAAGEGDSVIVNRSTDGGRTFERGVVAIQDACDSGLFIIRPGIAVQPRPQGEKLYAVGWYVVNPLNIGAQGGAGDRRTVVASSEDGGRTWSAPVEAQAPEEKVREIAPPVGPIVAATPAPGRRPYRGPSTGSPKVQCDEGPGASGDHRQGTERPTPKRK